MNEVIETILSRKSVRAYARKEIGAETKDQILTAALRGPTAGNLMLYSVIEVNDRRKKENLAKSCDNQPFIGKAPWVLLFLADYQRWVDYFAACDVAEFCRRKDLALREPREGDLFLACCDALAAAQTAVIAAESLGIGSCYIGDIMEQYEIHRDLFKLPRFVFPICLLCFGYPAPSQIERKMTSRFDRRFVTFSDEYHRLEAAEQQAMFAAAQASTFGDRPEIDGARNYGQFIYGRKFGSSFAAEMNRSVRLILKRWNEGGQL